MEIIPVIDLQRGQVVRARFGRRSEYQPIETPLSTSSNPVDVAHGLLKLYPFEIMYVADLDAIEGAGENDSALARLKTVFPDLAFWVDNGVREIEAARHWLAADLGHLVLGSETQSDLRLVETLAGESNVLLSLDFRGEAFQGPPELLTNSALWPQRIIAMTLARVGSAAGPDIQRLAHIHSVAPDRRLYAAGGVRHLADVETLARANVSGALVSTALHAGDLRAEHIARAHSLTA
jgi:phosphoribosylformimino-5-aminoimidazole carboxamide ribotide isomerase